MSVLRQRWWHVGWGVCVVVLTAGAAGAEPAQRGPVSDANTQVELLARQSSVQPGGSVTLGLRIEPDEGWHTYWLNPGGSGAPTRLSWELPEGFEAGEARWPAPGRHEYFGITNYGFDETFLLPVTIDVPEQVAGDTVRLAVQVDWLTCEQICIAGSAELAIALPVSEDVPGMHDEWAEHFERAEQRMPVEPKGVVRAQRAAEAVVLTFELEREDEQAIQQAVEDAYFFHEERGLIAYGQQQTLRGDGEAYTLVLPLSRANMEAEDFPERLKGVLSFEKGGERHAWQVDVALQGLVGAP